MHGQRSGFVPRHVTGLPPFGYHFRRLDNQINNEVKNEELRQAMEIFVCMKRAGVSEIAARTWAEIRADDVLGRAAQLAYYFFLALFPFLIFVIASLECFWKRRSWTKPAVCGVGQAAPGSRFPANQQHLY